jgi:signal recognition particle subunit SRP54
LLLGCSPIGGFIVRGLVFESLTSQLQTVFQGLGRRGKLRPEDVDVALREIRLALLEADVHYQVVKDLLDSVRVRALGEEVSRAINPAQQVIRIIYDELTQALGETARLSLHGPKPRVILLVGLQGSGKTTTAAKLARMLRAQGERVWLVAADPYRPAAVEQLQTLGDEIGVPVFNEAGVNPADLCAAGVERARNDGGSVVIIDTAGRSQLDDELMREIGSIQNRVEPVEVLLVADSMTGQEAINIAQGFHDNLELTGLILTKMDGDARGGAAISIRAVTGIPIKFLGVGESRDAFEVFEAERLASRILGMGDLKGLIEQAASMDVEDAEQQAAKILEGDFTLEDFNQQISMMRNMGPISKLLDMMPNSMVGLGGTKVDGVAAERQIKRTQAILQSMTVKERQSPKILNASRKRRIALGSGTSVPEVNQLLRQYKQTRKLMKKIGKRGLPTMGKWPL